MKTFGSKTPTASRKRRPGLGRRILLGMLEGMANSPVAGYDDTTSDTDWIDDQGNMRTSNDDYITVVKSN